MDTTSFYFETDDFRFRRYVKTKGSEEINEKATIEKIYSELNNHSDKK